jgi:chromate transporter
MDEILLLLVAGIIGMLWNDRTTWLSRAALVCVFAPFAGVQISPPGEMIAQGASLTGLGLFFLKIGSILYGSGYVLIAFLQGGLVDTRHWLSQAQLFDAIAVGQFTPGPVLSTATFIGYLILGLPGATVATAGIFLPSYVFVLISNPLIPKLRSSVRGKGFLDGVNAASLGLMLAVTVKLASGALPDAGSRIILGCASLALLLWNLNTGWIVAGSALFGWLFSLL